MYRKDIFSYITSFFTNYLDKEAGLSINTIKSYRDVFVLFFTYIEDNNVCKISKLKMDVLTIENVTGFLDWIEESRGCCINSRNQRLAAIKSFCSYVIRKNPETSNICQKIFSIKIKKTPQKSVEYLTQESISNLLKMPDKRTKKGMRDLAMLSLLYESGCRVQELIDLKLGEISFRTPNTVKLTGKGNKARVIPISFQVANILMSYVKVFSMHDSEHNVFVNRHDKALTRSGVTYVLKKYAHMLDQTKPEDGISNIHPHILRHSKAMHMLENGVNLIYIRDFLGHSSITTTEIYAKCNPELKRKHIELAGSLITESVEEYSEPEKKSLISWLRNNI